MKALLPVAALLALTACASPPVVTAMVEQPAQEEEAEPADLVEPWNNPVSVTPGEPALRRTVQQILNEQNAASERSVNDGAWKNAKLRYRWVDGETYTVVAAKKRITTLKLFPGEGFNNFAYGDENFGPELVGTWSGTRDGKAMQFGPAQVSIPVTPWFRNRCTDLTVYTTWRDILINLCSTGTEAAYNKVVEWWMPGEELRRFADALATGEVSAPTIEPSTGIPNAEVKVRYKPANAPEGWNADDWVAFNDGKRTYVVPPVDLPFEPVPAVRAGGVGNTVEFRKRNRLDGQGSYFQIASLPPEILMVHGADMLSLRRVSQ
jgi:type IV secretory pathway VirB9-like protein